MNRVRGEHLVFDSWFAWIASTVMRESRSAWIFLALRWR